VGKWGKDERIGRGSGILLQKLGGKVDFAEALRLSD
jgi:hypothetical protein